MVKAGKVFSSFPTLTAHGPVKLTHIFDKSCELVFFLQYLLQTAGLLQHSPVKR